MALTQTQVSQLYVSVFGRASEGTGNTYWQTDQADMTATAEVMLATDDAKTYFGTTLDDDQAFIEHIYNNTLGKTIDDDPDGIAYWVAELAAGKTKADVIVALINAAQDTANAGNAQDQFNNKVEVSNYTADKISDYTDLATFTGFISGVTHDAATVTSAKGEVDYVAPPVSGDTFTLTENVEVTTGSAADDTFNAYTKFTAIGQVNTLQSGDSVNGGAGNDTLVAESVGAGTTIAATLNSIENLQLTSYGNLTIEAANATDLLAVDIANSVATTTVRNLSQIVDLTVRNQTGGNNVTIGYTDTALAGSNTQKITLNNVTMKAAGGNIRFDDNNGAGTLDKLDIAVTGTSNIAGITDAAGGTNILDGVTDVMVNATAKADLGVINTTKMTTFDASASTAAVTADISAAAGNDLTIKGGAGDDVITFGATGNLNANDSIDLGEGTNTLKITGSANAASYDTANVQTLEVTTAAVGTTINAEAFGTGVSTIGFVSALNAHTAIVNNATEGDIISAKDAVGGGGASNTLTALTLNGKNTSGSSDSATVKLFSSDEGTTTAPNTFTLTTLTANGFENINLTSEGKANTNNTITTLTAPAQKTITIDGDKKLTIGSNLTATTVDATTSTGGVNLSLAGTGVTGGKQTATGGTGADTFKIDISVLSKDVKIDGGDGTDTLALAKAAIGNIDLTGVTNAELISNVSNFENLSFGGETLLIDDATLNRFTDKTVNVLETGVAATALDASAVLGSTSQINVNAAKMTAGGFTLAISNGIDSFTGSTVADTITVKSSAFLTDADTLAGGTGNNNVLNFDVTGAAKQIVIAAQLTNVSNFDTWNIKDSAATANDFSLTVSNAVAAQNINNGDNTLTISAAGNVLDKITLDASDVSSAYSVDYTANNVKNTIKLGAGNDVITLGNGTDTVTLGEGKDDVIFNALSASNTIKDFNFGTATGTGANVDQLNFSNGAYALNNKAAGAVIAKASDGAFAATDNVLILDKVGYADSAAADTALIGSGAGDVLILWQNTLGQTILSHDTNANAAGGFTDIAMLDAITITGVASTVDAGDFIL